MKLITCSSLTRNCRWWKTLQDQRPRHPKTVEAQQEGTRFGLLVQDWLEKGVLPTTDDEPSHWLSNMLASWLPPAGVQCEVPLGLSVDGHYIQVFEPEPHVYKPAVGGAPGLLTAGRADLVWVAGGMLGPVVYVGDLKRSAWKLGAPEQHPQLMALGLAAAAKRGARYLRLGLYDARDALWEWSDVIDLEAEGPRMLEEVREMATMPDEPLPGEWCQGCYERTRCKEAA